MSPGLPVLGQLVSCQLVFPEAHLPSSKHTGFTDQLHQDAQHAINGGGQLQDGQLQPYWTPHASLVSSQDAHTFWQLYCIVQGTGIHTEYGTNVCKTA